MAVVRGITDSNIRFLLADMADDFLW